MIVARVPDGSGLLLLGSVRGSVSDAAMIAPRLDEFRPAAVAIALSEEEARGIREYFVESAAEPVVALTGNEVAEIRGLVRYGEVDVPNPTWAAALEWGRAHRVPVEAVDPSDETFAAMFTDHIGYTELVRRTLRERSLTRHPPAPPTADEYAVAWGQRISARGGSERLAKARDAVAANAARAIGARAGRLALIVDRERFDGILTALGSGGGAVPPAAPLS